MLTGPMQAALYWARKLRRSRAMVSALTAWKHGLVVSAGQSVQSFGLCYRATTTGTTGTTPPSGYGASFNDGGVHWAFVQTASITVPPSTP